MNLTSEEIRRAERKYMNSKYMNIPHPPKINALVLLVSSKLVEICFI